MPCNSDHMKATGFERELSRVAAVIGEVERHESISTSAWDGYHPDVYCKNLTRADADKMVAHACALMQRRDPSHYSLEVQSVVAGPPSG